jgi:hypothetical protein
MKTHILGLIFISLTLVNCAKSAKTGHNANSKTNSSGYVTCPASGVYIHNGASYSCTPGSQFYVGTTSTTNGYINCPATGTYVSGGMTYNCTPGTQVYSGGTGTNSNTQGYCSQYTAMYSQYGYYYVLVNYQGQYVCMRSDLSGGYQIIGY